MACLIECLSVMYALLSRAATESLGIRRRWCVWLTTRV